MLGWYPSELSETYTCVFPHAAIVEGIVGLPRWSSGIVYGQDLIPIPPTYDYRVYRCFYSGDQPSHIWEDITGTDLYSVIDNVVHWNHLEDSQYLAVKSDQYLCSYDLDIPLVNGNLFFELAAIEDRGIGDLPTALSIPPGTVEIFLNGKSLIRDLDYTIKFPTVYIINKKFLYQPANTSIQKIHIRMRGFCQDMALEPPVDYGFIEYGYLSNNDRYDVRDDLSLRITVDGGLVSTSDVQFSEDHTGVSVLNSINGLPYQIQTPFVPLRDLVTVDSYEYRESSRVVDTKVKNYMTVLKPQPDRSGVNVIQSLYTVFSPFMSRLIADLVADYIKDSDLNNGNMNTEFIFNMCKNYEYLLEFDPISVKHQLNTRYVQVECIPGVLTYNLSYYKYLFLTKVVAQYTHGLIDITSFITFTI
jgi:hypothetical protein